MGIHRVTRHFVHRHSHLLDHVRDGLPTPVRTTMRLHSSASTSVPVMVTRDIISRRCVPACRRVVPCIAFAAGLLENTSG